MPVTAAITAAEERFEVMRRRVGTVLAPALGLALWLAPLPLPAKAHTLAAVFAFTVVLWMTEAVPMAVASLIGPVLLVLGDVAPMEKVFAPFADKVIFLFLGSFLLAEAMQKHGLDRRIALSLMSVPGVASSPGRMLATLCVLTAVLSMWMSNTAITAVMLPILLGVLRAQPALESRPGLAGALVLAVAFSASIGGLATPVGTPTNLVALGQLEKFGLARPGFAEWMKFGVPLMLAMLVVLFAILRARVRGDFGALGAEFRRQRALLPRTGRGEWSTAIVFCLAVTLWLLPGFIEMAGSAPWLTAWLKSHLPEELIGLGAGLLLFILPGKSGPVLEWRDSAKVEWGTLLLFGGGFAIGMQIKETGLSDAIGRGVAGALGTPGEGTLIAVAILVSILLSEATSNVASATVMVPLMIGVAQQTGADPARVALATSLACSLGFMLPISTPPNALAYGTGRVRLPMMMKYGLLLDLAGGAVVWLIVRALGV